MAIKLVVFYISGNAFVFQPLIVLFAAVTGISGNTGWLLFIGVDMILKMCYERTGICGLLMYGIGGDELIISTNLNIIAGLELTIAHVIFLHPHEGGILIGFAVTAPVLPNNLFLLFILFQLVWPVLLGIIQFLFNAWLNFFVFYRFIDCINGLLH